MLYSFVYRSVRYGLGHDIEGTRAWAIYPPGATGNSNVQGVAGHVGGENSFKAAKLAAQTAIDAWLEGHVGSGASEPDVRVLAAER